jgi:cold shock CspA family protein
MGQLDGNVKWFSIKKGFGIVTVRTPDSEHVGQEFFVHYTNIASQESTYRRLYPGEYVSFSLGKDNQGRDTCIDVRGIHGGPLLADNTEYRYKVIKMQPTSTDTSQVEEKTEDDAEVSDEADE